MLVIADWSASVLSRLDRAYLGIIRKEGNRGVQSAAISSQGAPLLITTATPRMIERQDEMVLIRFPGIPWAGKPR